MNKRVGIGVSKKWEVDIMKQMHLKNKILWGISMIGLIGISYLLCRFVFYGMHGMKQWPNLLAIVGLIIIVVASLLGNRLVSASTVVGYMGGFILAMIFNTDGLDQGGGRINNAWKIWTTVLILSILIGSIISFISRQRYKV